MSKVLASTRLSTATTVLVVGLVFAVAAAVSMVVLSRDGGAVEAAEGQPLGRVINLTTTEGGGRDAIRQRSPTCATAPRRP